MIEEQTLRTTRFSDVCGSVDELKRLLREETTPDSEMLSGLMQDVRDMLGRMERRLQEYAQFEQEAESVLKQIRTVRHSRREERAVAESTLTGGLSPQMTIRASVNSLPRLEEALNIAAQLDRTLESQFTAEEVEALCLQAEQIREVANEMEQKLRTAKQASITLYQLYLRLRGQRDWSCEENANTTTTHEDEESALSALINAEGLTAKPQTPVSSPTPEGLRQPLSPLEPWLPPSPHLEHLLDFLKDGRAHLLPAEGKNQIPYVEFYGGGVIPLLDVRWSESVRNFYPAGQEPHPSALQHRGR